MKKSLLNPCTRVYNSLKNSTKLIAAAGLLALGISSEASAQWVVYNADVLPADFTESPFVTASVNPAGDFTEGEFAIVADPDVEGNSLLRMRIDGNPHTTFLWRQNFPANPETGTATPAATIVVRAKGIEGVARAFELDLDFNSYRETVYINNNGTFTFNVARATDPTKNNAPLEIDPLEWHTYRFAKDGATLSMYIDEAETPFVTATVPASAARTYFRIGDGASAVDYASYIDFIAWDLSGAFSPEQSPLPSPTSTRLAKAASSNVSVYPNPATDRFTVSHPVASRGANIEVYAINGTRVASFSADQGSNHTNLSVASFKQGMYIISYTDNNQKVTSRFVKQ